jgi:hypothetical protein
MASGTMMGTGASPMTEHAASAFGLGRVAVRCAGSDPILPYVADELAAQPAADGQARATLAFHFGSERFEKRDWVRIGPVGVGADRLDVDEKRLAYQIPAVGLDMEIPVRSLLGSWSKPALRELVRAPDQSFLNAPGRIAKNFFYNVFDQVVQIQQLPVGQSWVHSSAVTNGSRTIALMAWGGVGKTSSLLKILETGAWQYLSDDLALIDEDGVVYRTPQRMQVYAYNLEGQPALRDQLLGGRRPVDLLQWHARARLLGPKAVRRRVHPSELFGRDAVADQGVVTDAVFLRRTSSEQFRVHTTDAAQLADMCTNVLDHELSPLNTLAAAANSSGLGGVIPDSDELRATTRAVIKKGIDAANPRCMILDVPPAAGPEELFSFLSVELRL